MSVASVNESPYGKFAGFPVTSPGIGRVELTSLLHRNSETSIYATSRPNAVVKTFDLDCGKADEVSYGPFVGYRVEVENWQDIQALNELRLCVPEFYGADIDYERKVAWIAMEFLQGQDFLAWCSAGAEEGYTEPWAAQFRAALFETLTIVRLFHKHGIVLIDFKPDNVIRLDNGAMKFVDLGAFFTPRHSQETEKYVYSATPDYAELVIDTSMVLTGNALKQGGDIFSAGVAMFEMATGNSRLGMAGDCADQMISLPEIYLFRDSQIRDIWKAYPHLKDLLPLIQTQLRERRILFSEFWHLLKGYLAAQAPNWESMSDQEHRQMLLETGTNFINDQLPDALKWLAEPIALATTLRSYRTGSIEEILARLAMPIPEGVWADLAEHNPVVRAAHEMKPPVEFREPLNTWDLRPDPRTGHWAISSRRLAHVEFRDTALFTFLRQAHEDEAGQRYYEIVNDLETDMLGDDPLTLDRLARDPCAWL